MGADARLRINADRLGDIREIIHYLRVLEEAYNHLYALDLIVQDAKTRYAELNKNGFSWNKKEVRTIISVKKPEEVVLPEDRLQILSVVIKSPGFWEFLGSINPLEVVRKYLCDRHERRKDKAYRNRQEEEQGELKNEKLRIEVVREKVELLKECGVPEDKIRRVLFEHVIKPLGALDTVQERVG